MILFADDTTVYKGHRNLNYLKWCLESDLAKLVDWFKANKLTLNVDKTVYILFSSKDTKEIDNIVINNKKIQESESTKFLGLCVDKELN